MQLDPKEHIAHHDVRLHCRTDRGESLLVRYTGLLHVDGKASKVLQYESDAKSTQFGDHYWFTAPKFETSDSNLKWVEDSFFITDGRFVVEEGGYGVEYEIYRVIN